jgi:hypothetical protein
MKEFERELEDKLGRFLDPITAGPIPARRVKATLGATMTRLLIVTGAGLRRKLRLLLRRS